LTSKSVIQRWYSRLLFLLVAIFVIWFLWRNIGDLKNSDFQYEPLWLFLSIGVLCLSYLMRFFLWLRIAPLFGLKAPVLVSARAYFLSQLGKYVPGKAGLLLTRLDVYRGVSKRKITLATAVEYIACFSAACMVVFIGLLTLPDALPVYVRWTAFCFSIILLLLLWPPFLIRLYNRASTLLKKDTITEIPSYPVVLLFVSFYIIPALTDGLSLFLVLRALGPLSPKWYLAVSGAYNGALLLGILVLFAPGGIGVREGVLFMVLPAFVTKATVIVGTGIMRLNTTIVELLLAGSTVIIDKIYHRCKAE
jgi:uncharacterized membrane protein YbhN (UPF0104 family)